VSSSKTLLPIVLGGVVAMGGILQGLHWRTTSASSGMEDLETQLRMAVEENELLKRENQALRSLAQGGGEIAVPREAIDRVEKDLGLVFRSSPVIHRIASEELRDRIAAAFESRLGPAGIDDRQEAWRHIGWIGPDDDLLTQLTIVRSVGARGWFDEVTGEGWVTDRYDPESIPDQAAMIRLLARILLNQHFPPAPAHPGDDAARAREALHHGAALAAETRFYAFSARSIGFMPVQPNNEAEQIFKSLPDFIRGITTFSAIEGKGYADTAFIRGEKEFHDLLRNPPQTTLEILMPMRSPTAQPISPPTLPEEPHLKESAGLLGVKLWLASICDPDDLALLSTTYHGDLYFLLPDGQESTALVWDVEFLSEDGADRFQKAALARVAEIKESVEPSPGSAPRTMKISRASAIRVRFINAQTPALVEAFN